jgi:hypothetical protein
VAGATPVLVHNVTCDLEALRSQLPPKFDTGPTSGIAKDNLGNVSGEITSGGGTFKNLIARANSRLAQWGFRTPAARAVDVEQKVAASMLNADGSSRISSVDLVINNSKGVCGGPLGCDMVLPYILNEGQSLTVHYVDDSGVWHSNVYQGLANFN